MTDLWRYLAVHGVFITLLIGLLFYAYARMYRFSTAARMLPRGKAEDVRLFQWDDLWANVGPRWAAYAALSTGGVTFLALNGYATIAFLLAGLLLLLPLVWKEAAIREEGMAIRLMVYTLATMPLVLGIFVDLFTFSNDIGRLNTVFKFYLQAWVLLGIVGAFSLWRVSCGSAIPWRRVRTPWQAFIALLIAASLIYPVLGTAVRVKARFNVIPSTIDGMTYMDRAAYEEEGKPLVLQWDKLGIQAMQDLVEGSPVIVEGLTPLYRWGNRVSIYTGLPTVIGWDHHQKQQRGDYVGRISGVDQRRFDVESFYRSPDPSAALRFIQKYGVKYIYVGQLERNYYPALGIAKFETMAGGQLEMVYQNEQVQIYRVR